MKTAIDYKVLTEAINTAALSRRAALNLELAVGLVHFTQETDGTSATGKANLKAVYNAAGYDCMDKNSRDYKTVNRRLNACAKLFDKLSSNTVNSYMEDCKDTKDALNGVLAGLAAYSFHTMDDVLEFVGSASNRTKTGPRQPIGPVETVEAGEGDAEGEGAAPAAQADVKLNLNSVLGVMLAQYGNEILREFADNLLTAVAQREAAEAPALKAA